MKKTKKHLFALTIYFLLGLFFFKEIIFQTHWLVEDFFTQNFPNRNFAAVEIRNGSFPLWNPFVYSGMPFYADIQTGVLYPFNLLLSFFVKDGYLSYAVYEYQVILHVVLGAFLMYLFLEILKFGFFSSLLGGILFGFNFFFINHIHHSNMIHSAIWLPAVFYCCHRGFKDNSKWFWYCPILLTISLFGGHPQMTIFILYTFSAYYFFQLYIKRRYATIKISIFRFAIIIILFFLLSLVQILPTAEFLLHTERASLNYAGAVKDSLPLRSLLSIFMDGLFRNTYESWQRWEFGCYMSVGAMLLTMLAFIGKDFKERFFWFFFAVLCLILALGENTPLYKASYLIVPGFDFFRVPARFIFLFIFSISVLASYGFFTLLRNEEVSTREQKRLFVFIAFLFFLVIPFLSLISIDSPSTEYHKTLFLKYFGVASVSFTAILITFFYKKRLHIISFAILLVISADLFIFRGMYNQQPMNKKDMFNAVYNSPVALVLQNEKEGSRFLAKYRYAINNNFGLIYRKSNIWGYNPFQLRLYQRLNPDSPRTASLLGAKFIDYKDLKTLAGIWRDIHVFKINNGFFINENPIPRAFLVSRSKFDPDFDLQKNLDSGEFNPLEIVYLNKNYPQENTIEATPYNIMRYENNGNEIQIDIESKGKGFLVLTEIYYPGWRVYVNNMEKELLRADTALRSVFIEEGENHVKFVFLPSSFIIGSIVSIVTFSVLALFFSVPCLRRQLF